MSQTETAAVAADLTTSILGEFAVKHADENAERMLNELGQTAAAPPAPAPVVSNATPAAEAAAPVSEPVTETSETTEETLPVPDFTPQLSEELQALLDEPDFDEEAAAEVAAEAADTYDENYDQETAARLRAQDKKIKWLEDQNANKSRKGWMEEQAAAYPFLREYAAKELKEALASVTSRRAAARVAHDLNEKYTRVLGPAVADLNAAKAIAKGEATAEARLMAKENWGLPSAEPAGGAAVSEQERKLQAAREGRAPLVDRIKILMGG